MPAPQQSSVPTYKETANIRGKQVDYYQFDARDMPGAALARLLGAVPDAFKAHKALADEDAKPGEMEQKQLVALAQMGAERDRVKLGKGSSVFGLLRDKEGSMDAYEYNRGRREADLLSGQLRDAYAQAKLFENDDPKAFAAFVQQQQANIFKTLEGSDPSYYTGFLERVGGVFEEMATAHAGHLDGFVTHKNKAALEARVGSRVAVDLAITKERTAFGSFMDQLMGAESGGNYNAYYGNANNQRIRFTDMTVGEVLEWQRQQAQSGRASTAVGKYQFIHKTLQQVVRETGIDPNTKFSPAIQDQLIFHRLVKDRGFMRYLNDEISAEELLDQGLALEFAGLKKTSGKGHYDGDGLNRATMSASRTLAALKGFKQAYIQDPASVVKKTKDGRGKIVLPDVTDPLVNTDDAEAEFGVSGSEERATVADALINEMEKNPAVAQRDDLEDLMTKYKLPVEDRERVNEARGRILQETDLKATREERKVSAAVMKDANDFLLGGDEEALQRIRHASPELFQKLLSHDTVAPDPDTLDNEGFLKGTDFSSPRVDADALKAYIDGTIDLDTYRRVSSQASAMKAARPVVELPAVSEMIATVKRSIPVASDQRLFDQQLAISIEDLLEVTGGKRPPLSEIQAAIMQVQQAIVTMRQQDVQTRMSRPEYQIGNKNGE